MWSRLGESLTHLTDHNHLSYLWDCLIHLTHCLACEILLCTVWEISTIMHWLLQLFSDTWVTYCHEGIFCGNQTIKAPNDNHPLIIESSLQSSSSANQIILQWNVCFNFKAYFITQTDILQLFSVACKYMFLKTISAISPQTLSNKKIRTKHSTRIY